MSQLGGSQSGGTDRVRMPGDRLELEVCRTEAGELAWDLAWVQGALSEIATCWRRAFSRPPDLPLRLPLQLADAARVIGVEVARLVNTGPSQFPVPAMDVARRFAAFQRDIALARALTDGPEVTQAGDGLLWESVDQSLRRARGSMLRLIVALVLVDSDWSSAGLPDSAAPAAGRAVLASRG